MDVSLILNNLNDAQRAAVCAPLSNQLVLAGAGSGKTRVLVHRIAWLCAAESISPYSILAVTFTNKAAREMRARLEGLLGDHTRGMWVGTFHGLAHRLLKAHYLDAGLPENFQILDSDDQLRLIKRISRDLNLDESRWPARQTQWFINARKDEGLRASHIDECGDAFQAVMLQIYRVYEESCQRAGTVDFGELLLRSHEVWLKKPLLLQHYQQRFRHMLVDEFQDTNTIQYAWLRVLAGTRITVTAVGDDDQSIYGWRGAKIENIHHFSREFVPVQTVRLEQNYRSTATILAAANSVIARNRNRLGKELWTAGVAGEKISIYAGFNEVDEANYIVSCIESDLRTGSSRDEFAILYRSNAQSRTLEDALLRAAIPYRIYGGQRFYERLEIRNALAYMRLLANSHDNTAVERAINMPPRGIGGKTLANLRQQARDDGSSLWQSADAAVKTQRLVGRAANAVSRFIELIGQLQQQVAGLPLHELADHVIEASGLLEFHGNEKADVGRARVENLQELVSACKSFEVDTQDPSSPLQQFLDRAALDAGDRQADESEPAVQLMTVHSAKGLEFDRVFISGLEESLFPHKMSMEDPAQLEEERRLCYVGITRARHQLCLSYAQSRRLHGVETMNAPSRFIREIPAEYLDEIRLHAPIGWSGYASQNGRMLAHETASGLNLGGRVTHKVFGEGVVLQVEGAGENARVQVNFDRQGSKWLVLHYAGLQAL